MRPKGAYVHSFQPLSVHRDQPASPRRVTASYVRGLHRHESTQSCTKLVRTRFPALPAFANGARQLAVVP
jgi:hypothetical protein